jgi:bacteriocin biosynthesis cyclodehydratase domain-containing protein
MSAEDLKRPRIRRTLRLIEAPDGDIYLLDPGSARDLKIRGPDEFDRRLLHALDGTWGLPDLETHFGSPRVEDALAALDSWGALEDAADDDRIEPGVLDRFDRQLRYFSDVMPKGSPSECQEHLESATVAVLGIGGLGGWSAMSLACCGVGKMILVDYDHVERTNLNRQVMYEEGDVGRLKVEVAAERLSALDSNLDVEILSTRLESAAQIEAVISDTQVVIDAVDWPAHHIEHWVNEACFNAGIPYISMSHSPPNARVGPFYLPGSTGCYACLEIAYRRQYPLYDLMVEQLGANPSPGAVIGPACAHIGGHVSLDLMHYLTGIAPPSTLGTAFIYDLRTLDYRQEAIQQEPNCSICRRTG